MQIVVTVRGRTLSDLAERTRALSADARTIMASALNAAGAEVRAATVAAETAQTGLAPDTIDRAQQESQAAPGRLALTIASRGGNVRLKFFHPTEGGGGVTATPWNRPKFYAGSFLTSGRLGARYQVKKLNGQVFERDTPGSAWNRNTKAQVKRAIRVVRSGLFIPKEMVKGETAEAFLGRMDGVASVIISRIGGALP